MKCDTCYIKYCDEETEYICKTNDYCKYMPEKKNKNELKPCPFCGGKAHIETEKMVPYESMILEQDYWYYVECVDCGASIYFELTQEDAMKNWNRRTYA